MSKEEAKSLLDKYINGNCNQSEKVIVERWYVSESSKQQLADIDEEFISEKKEIWSELSKHIKEKQRARKSRNLILIWGSSAAAILLLTINIPNYFFKEKKALMTTAISAVETPDIGPGRDKAILTLADGRKIIIDEKDQGQIADQSGIKITKASDGTIVYIIPETIERNPDPVPYNTIETPKGGKFQIILPDQTKVWLNAASILKFPALFTGKERLVELSGEAYFDVAKNSNMPFNVKTRDVNVIVTGTEFNIMAYYDEPFSTTTLVEGSVRVSNQSERISLNPGEQAFSDKKEQLSKKSADVEEAIAWKSGLFQFNNADINTVMNQLSRWYDVSVEYRSKVPDKRFGGYISRNSNLSQVLKMLELSGLKFEIEDKKIIVLP
ncbi:MAG: FecR family protein [Pedobacter sp.]|jgi:hypothetical protein